MSFPSSIFYRLLVAFIFLFSGFLSAQNPFVTKTHNADPTARVFNNRLYVYPSTDVPGCNANQGDNGYCMPNYRVFSTTDLVNWTDHGIIIEQNNVPWVKPNSFGMWAPDCVFKNGTYYHFFPAPPKEGGAFRRIGVATSTSPTGPFTPEPNYIQGVNGFDPGVLVDGNETYLYYVVNGSSFKVVRLSNDLKRTASSIIDIPVPLKQYEYIEGPFTFKRGNTYYLTFAHVADRNGIRAYEIGYSTSQSPTGPFTYRGTIMPPINPFEYETNHASFVNFKGSWYMFYHHWSLSGNDRLRSIRADEIFFNPDGTIQQKVATLRGVGVPKAGDIIQIDRYNEIFNAQVHVVQGNEPNGFQVDFVKNNGWVKFNKADFGNGNLKTISARIATPNSGGRIEIRTGATTGPLLATINVPSTGSWENWQTVTANFSGSTSGVKNLVCVFKGSADYLFNVNWVKFESENGSSSNEIPFGREVFIKGHNGQYLSSRLNVPNIPVRSNSSNRLLWERFTFVNAGNGKVALKSVANNKYVSARLDKSGVPLEATADKRSIWESFEWKSNGNNKFSLKAYSNKWVSARFDEVANPLKATKGGNPLNWENFSFEFANNDIKDPVSLDNQTISLYPNPAKDNVTVTGVSSGDVIRIYDILGKKLIETVVGDSEEINVPIKTLKSGNYFLSVPGKVKKSFIVK